MNTIRNLFGMNKDKSQSDKYHGLVNQGATCYLNSVLQVLFMTPDFRERVTSHTRSNPETEHFDRELSDLFIQLEGNIARTNNITNKLKIINVNKQSDAAELYDKILRLTSPGAAEIFHGELTNRNKCQECATVTERAAGFWHLPLPLVDYNNDYSVERGIEDFFRPRVISGDDQMYCENCDEKCDAVLDCAVKHHPEVLTLLIKRFEFDFTRGTYLKINCLVDVPYSLNVQNQTYELYGAVEHLNEQRFCRYIATIKSQRDGRWYTFDDRNVTVSRRQYFQEAPVEKSRTAYLLFYQRRPALLANTYNGLLNLGATCYLNSILQVLFMTQDFKQSVTRHNRNNPKTEHIDHELSDLFSELEKRPAYTYNIAKKLQIDNVDEQRDAAEHYEKILRLTSPEASQIFHGELQNKNKCLKCGTPTESTTRFWHLPLSLLDSQEDSYSVFTSLRDFLRRDVQMYCVTCEEECQAVLECELKHQPHVLVIMLKRFEYDDRHMTNIKNNREVDVPYTLYMPQTYELYACVEHFGELGFGHYIARIRSHHDGRWYIFDGLNISVMNILNQEHPMERSRTAYLLFYQKRTDDASEIPASTAETTQAEDAIAAQNTEVNMKEEEDAPIRPDMMSDETKTNGDVIHVKQQEIERGLENTREDLGEITEDGQDRDVDQLADSLHKMTISDHNESVLPQVDNVIMEAQSDVHDTTLRNTRAKPCFVPVEMPGRLKLTLRQADWDSHGKHIMAMSGGQDQESAGSGDSEETAPPQSNKTDYPDHEDFIRVQATKIFIRNEEQLENEEACGVSHSGFRSLPSDVNNAQLRAEGSGLRESISRGETVRRERDQSCKARFDGVVSLGVTEEGDTEIVTYKPKKRQDNEQNTNRRRSTGSSQYPEMTRHSTQV